MCAIFATQRREDIPRLSLRNGGRGGLFWSVTVLTRRNNEFIVIQCKKGNGDFPTDIKFVQHGDYYICHAKYPTSSQDGTGAIHPAEKDGSFLWHNGISMRKTMQKSTNSTAWDTEEMLKKLLKKDFSLEVLGKLDGSFACVYLHKGHIFVFRNDLAPLYHTDDCTLSSVECGRSYKVEAFKLLKVSPNFQMLVMGKFDRVEKVYYGV